MAPEIRGRRWHRIAIACLLTGVAAAVALAFAAFSVLPRSSAVVKERVVRALSDQFDADVDLARVTVSVLPAWRVDLDGLAIRQRGRQDLPPLIKVSKITATGTWMSLWRRHVREIALTGLEINIPPSGIAVAPRAGAKPTDLHGEDIVIDRLTTIDARLVIIPDSPEKHAKVWNIRELQMQTLGANRAMPFRADIRNAVPPGDIVTRGSLGPWQTENPGGTALEGTFTFEHADLSVFKGISGMLSAHGEFGGSLQRIGVHGETDVPAFALTMAKHPLPLHADYHSTVDGTNGNTVLDRIDAKFLGTSLTASGSVIDNPGPMGRTVSLGVVMTKARIDDILHLAVKGSPAPLAGALTLSTKLVIPPGDIDVVEKLRLDGRFAIGTATFASFDIQDKVNELSQRGRGQTVAGRSRVASNFVGQFHLADGLLALRTLEFDVPGAQVQLAGTYGLRDEHLSFRGALELDAKMSETQKGWKRLALKVLDPIFEKPGGGGTFLPIKIEGPRSEPVFGVDKGSLFKRREPAKKANTPTRSSPETRRHPHPG